MILLQLGVEPIKSSKLCVFSGFYVGLLVVGIPVPIKVYFSVSNWKLGILIEDCHITIFKLFVLSLDEIVLLEVVSHIF